MTIFLPLEEGRPPPSTPSFLLQVREKQRHAQLARVVQAIMKAKRVVIICGAGISVQAGIPDFRSQEGLFRTLKRDNPREALNSGKDLFDASVFHTETRTALFCQMMAQLANLSQGAEPTPFHHLLRALNDRGRLLRVYTQNIDAIEEKCGLSFGVPQFEDKKPANRSRLSKEKAAPDEAVLLDNPLLPHLASPSSTLSTSSGSYGTPRCIPLHGTLQQMHCQICRNSFPLQDYLTSLKAGQPPECPSCTALEETRANSGKRARGIGKLRPSVVLYNEAHHDGEGVGDVVQKDLMGSKGKGGADLLLVVGTSLKVPGTKRMVREFAKAVRTRGAGAYVKEKDSASSSGPSSAAASSRHTPVSDDEEASPLSAPVKAVYLNLDFPAPTREWEGVFDAWVQGDAQTFADTLQAELEKEARGKELALEKKRRKEEDLASHANGMDVDMHPACPPTPQTPKRKATPKARAKGDPYPPRKMKISKPKPRTQTSLPTPMSSSSSSPKQAPSTPPRPLTTPYSTSHLPTPNTTPTSQRRHPFDDLSSSDSDSSEANRGLEDGITSFLATSVRARFAQLRTPPSPYRISHRRLSFGMARDSVSEMMTAATTSSIRSTLLEHERDGGPVPT